MVARRAALAGATCAMTLMLAAARPAESHPLHTTMTELSHDPAARVLNTTLRVFADDFSAAVMPGSPRRAEVVVPPDSAIMRYVNARFVVAVRGGGRVPMRWCGMRREGDVLFLCLRGAVKGSLAGASLRNALLTEMFADQVNIVQASYDGRRHTLLFTPRDGAKPLP